METIIICPTCKGKGNYEIDDGYHQSDYKLVDCKSCNGTGRQVLIEWSFSIRIPIDKINFKKEVLDVQSKTFQMIRKIEKKIKDECK